jgi:hypothetical protein
MSQTTSEIQARLTKVRAAIDTILEGGVSEFRLEDNEGAKLLSLTELQRMEEYLEKKLARLRRGSQPRFIRGWRY